MRAQLLINLEIPVLVQSLKSSNVELGLYLDDCSSVARVLLLTLKVAARFD